VVYLYVHVIWSVARREAILTKPVRRVLFTHMQKDAGEKGMKIILAGGVEDHIHCLLQLMPSQNLAQVVKAIRIASADWLNDNKLLTAAFGWEEGYAAYSVSPSGVASVIDYIGKQEEVHRSKTLENELEIFEKFKESLV
jgi:REP element-mobilizing transposase RayT